MSESEIKPCPFCDCWDAEATNSWTAYYEVECQTCGATGPGPDAHEDCPDDIEFCVRREDDPELHERCMRWSVDLWNRRPREMS